MASYLAIALSRRKSSGVEIGSRIYRDLIEGHWDALFPTKARMRGRVAAIEWWAEKAESVLEQLERPLRRERINASREPRKVDQLCRRFSRRRRRSGLSSISSALSRRSLLRRNRRPANRSRPPRPRCPREGSLGTLGAGSLRSRAWRKDPQRSLPRTAQAALEKALGDIARVADYCRKKELSNPTAYRLAGWRRGAPWNPLPFSEDGRTNIPPPYTADSLRGLLGEGQDEALVRAAEQNLVEYIFWLDLNFWASEGLGRMGEGHQAAAEVVRRETALLLRRLPGLEDLKFSDGTPFAGDDTREWIKGLVAGAGGAAGGAPSLPRTRPPRGLARPAN